jgi:hypothetical protein
MPAPTVKIDDAKMLRKMKQYEKIVGKEVKQLVHNAGRLCCLELAKSTAPKGAGVAAKKQGEKKITKNIRGIFTIVNQKWWKEVTSGRAFSSGGAALHEKSGIVWALDSQDTIASVDVVGQRVGNSPKSGKTGWGSQVHAVKAKTTQPTPKVKAVDDICAIGSDVQNHPFLLQAARVQVKIVGTRATRDVVPA